MILGTTLLWWNQDKVLVDADTEEDVRSAPKNILLEIFWLY